MSTFTTATGTATPLATPRPASDPQQAYRPPPQGEWTYDDYARLPDNGFRYEVIHGDLYMSPAPRPAHQWSLGEIFLQMQRLAKEGDLGRVYYSPIDVVMGDEATPVQPDIIFIRKDNLGIVQDLVRGVPDLVVEAISRSTRRRDEQIKFRLYCEQGVREYWLVDVPHERVRVWVLRGEAYALLGDWGVGETATSEVLPGLEVAVAGLFD